MSKQDHYPVSKALRAAGFIPLPRLWVKATDMPKIHKIAHAYQEEVNSIRNQVYTDQTPQVPDPRDDRDAAWDAFERYRNQS